MRVSFILRMIARTRPGMSNLGGMITVQPPATAKLERQRGKHWKNDHPAGFKNPWESFRGDMPFWELFRFIRKHRSVEPNDPDRERVHELVPSVKPDFGVDLPASLIKATWLSHASFLIELPAPEGSTQGGINILIDPAYSPRCSPFQSFGGMLRFNDPPAKISDLPEIDVVIISHNHYDHCDITTLRDLYRKHADRPPVLFVGLNGASNLRSTVGKDTDIVEMDWWEERTITVEGKGKAKITCTPCQHTCSRVGWDRDQSLWASWAMHEIKGDGSVGASAWHAGDTGYCSVTEETHTIDPNLPVCPAFAEIGDRLGPFSVGLIPIGAYSPRNLMSLVHNAPIDAVRMFMDTKCKRAIAMHWGTWRMAMDSIAEPPEKLAEARHVLGLSEEDFGVVALGETKGYDA